MSHYDFNYRVTTALADITKGALHVRGIPVPDQPMYSDYSTRSDLTSGGQTLRGFSVVTWMWDELLVPQANTLVGLVETALDAGTALYLTIDLGWGGRYNRNRWVDVSGTPVVPVVEPVARRGAWLTRNFILRVVDLTVENDPADSL
jgi:hypothetical protein